MVFLPATKSFISWSRILTKSPPVCWQMALAILQGCASEDTLNSELDFGSITHALCQSATAGAFLDVFTVRLVVVVVVVVVVVDVCTLRGVVLVVLDTVVDVCTLRGVVLVVLDTVVDVCTLRGVVLVVLDTVVDLFELGRVVRARLN